MDNVEKAEAMALAEIPDGEIKYKKKTMLDIYREKEEVHDACFSCLYFRVWFRISRTVSRAGRHR